MEPRFGCAGASIALALGAAALAGTVIWGAGAARADHHEDPAAPAGDAHGSHPAPAGDGDAHAGHDHHGSPSGRHDATASHRFEDPEAWAARFEDPGRDAWQRPDEIVAQLTPRDDLLIADIGSATGYFPVRFARAVPRGLVYGADIEPGMVTYLNDRARAEGIPNLVSVLAGPESPHLPRAVDLVFLCNTYHHLNDRIAYLERLAEQMRPGGRIAVVDFRPESERGPPHKLDPAIVEEEMAAAGYTPAARHDFLPDQYFLVFAAPESAAD